MNSTTTTVVSEEERQANLKRQIAALQAQLDAPQAPPKRKDPGPAVLAPATPSPKKKRKLDHRPSTGSAHGPGSHLSSRSALSSSTNARAGPSSNVPNPLPPSNVLSKLAKLSHTTETEHAEAVVRTSAFAQRPRTPPPKADETDMDVFTESSAPKRDDRLALIEDLEVGPADHKPPFDDPFFDHLEPNSGIRLKARSLPHEDLQDHLRGRYFLSPSRLYASIRLLPDKQGYDVPVEGDWVTIAVVAERGPIKYSRAPVGIGRDDDDASNSTSKDPKKAWQRKEKPTDDTPTPKSSGKKYVSLKLVDFGSRSKSSATGGKAVIKGDAFLTLLLFESDGFDLIKNDEGGRPQKLYKGGSRGAFEALSKVKEGDVIALLNPRILKPFQRSADSPHPINNILAVTPESASTIVVIGRSKDLGMCSAVKRDGKTCGSWCDKRVSDVCDWHVQNAVQHRRAGRAEFSIGTSGLSSSAVSKRKPAYDPARQWGLKPEADAEGAGASYVVSGHIVKGSGSSADTDSLYIAENMGREGQAKAHRKKAVDEDKSLKALLDRDKEGMKAVIKAREVAEQEELRRKASGKAKGKQDKIEGGRGSRKGKEKATEEESASEETESPSQAPLKNAYSAQLIKQLGFDPVAAKIGSQRKGDSEMQKKLEALTAVQSARKDIVLGPRPGRKIRSGVKVPPNLAKLAKAGEPISKQSAKVVEDGMVDLDD